MGGPIHECPTYDSTNVCMDSVEANQLSGLFELAGPSRTAADSRLQNIHRPLAGRRNGRPKMGSINWKIQNRLKLCQKRMMPYMQICFGKCERLLLEGLHHWGEHLREALSGISSQRFTFSPASISCFWGCGFVCGFMFVLFFVVFWFVFVWCFPHDWDLLSCMRIVCELERPSELSWRARHGRKKKSRTAADSVWPLQDQERLLGGETSFTDLARRHGPLFTPGLFRQCLPHCCRLRTHQN